MDLEVVAKLLNKNYGASVDRSQAGSAGARIMQEPERGIVLYIFLRYGNMTGLKLERVFEARLDDFRSAHAGYLQGAPGRVYPIEMTLQWENSDCVRNLMESIRTRIEERENGI